MFRLLAAMVVMAALCVDTGSASSASDAVPPGCSAWPAAAAFCTGPPSNFEKGIGYPAAGGEAGPSTTSEVCSTSTRTVHAVSNASPLGPLPSGLSVSPFSCRPHDVPKLKLHDWPRWNAAAPALRLQTATAGRSMAPTRSASSRHAPGRPPRNRARAQCLDSWCRLPHPHPLTHSLTHPLAHSLTRPFIHSFTHSATATLYSHHDRHRHRTFQSIPPPRVPRMCCLSPSTVQTPEVSASLHHSGFVFWPVHPQHIACILVPCRHHPLGKTLTVECFRVGCRYAAVSRCVQLYTAGTAHTLSQS